MSYYDQFSALDFERPYSLAAPEKRRLFLALLNELGAHHRARSEPYAKIAASLPHPAVAERLEDLPFLPVRLFSTWTC